MSKKKKTRVKTEATFKKAVDKLCRYLRWHFFLNAYKLNIVYCIDERLKSDDREGEVGATIQIDDAYLRITLTLYRSVYDAYLNGELYEVLLHEFCHSLTDPLFQYAFHSLPDKMKPHFYVLREKQTEMISRLLASPEISELKKFDK